MNNFKAILDNRSALPVGSFFKFDAYDEIFLYDNYFKANVMFPDTSKEYIIERIPDKTKSVICRDDVIAFLKENNESGNKLQIYSPITGNIDWSNITVGRILKQNDFLFEASYGGFCIYFDLREEELRESIEYTINKFGELTKNEILQMKGGLLFKMYLLRIVFQLSREEACNIVFEFADQNKKGGESCEK